MSDKFFVATGFVTTKLHVSRTQLQKLFPHILHFYIPKRTTRLWPVAYIDALGAYHQSNKRRAATTNVGDFASLRSSLLLVEQIQEAFEKRLSSKEKFTANEVADLLCISLMTVTDWRKAGVFTSVMEEVSLKQGPGQGKRELHLFPQSELRRAGEWRLPQV